LFVNDFKCPDAFPGFPGPPFSSRQATFDPSEYETITDTSGAGRLGGVKRLRRKSDGKELVVKFFIPGKQRLSEFMMKYVLRELEALSALDHLCVMPIIGFQVPSPGKDAAIASEFMSNGSLADVLARVRAGILPRFWTPTGIAKLVTGLVLGMNFIHPQGRAPQPEAVRFVHH
jgi:serine/threonine protein kinase